MSLTVQKKPHTDSTEKKGKQDWQRHCWKQEMRVSAAWSNLLTWIIANDDAPVHQAALSKWHISSPLFRLCLIHYKYRDVPEEMSCRSHSLVCAPPTLPRKLLALRDWWSITLEFESNGPVRYTCTSQQNNKQKGSWETTANEAGTRALRTLELCR